MVAYLEINEMSLTQQISLCKFFYRDCLEDVEAITQALKKKYPEWDMNNMSQLLAEKHPGSHMFDGDVYIALYLKEESESPYIEMELLGLLEPKVFPELGRILYYKKKEDDVGDHDAPYYIMYWEERRISIAKYKEKLNESLSLLNEIK